MLAGSVGEVAEWIFLRVGARLPWGVRLAIAVFWDLIDIGTRIVFWPLIFLVPGAMFAVRAVLDFFLVLIGSGLAGRTGLLQAMEVVFGAIPGFGWMFDLVPMLTIAVFIRRRMERETQQFTPTAAGEPLPAAQERMTPPMVLLFGFGGVFLWFTLWWFEQVSFLSVVFFAVAGAVLGFILPFLREIELPPRLRVGSMVFTGGLLVLSLTMLAYYGWGSPEDYRRAAWGALVDERDGRVGFARKADELGQVLTGEGVSEITAFDRELLKEALKRHKGFGVPFLDDLKKKLVEGPKQKPAPAAQATPQEQAREARTQQEVSALKLGRMQRMLYGSDYVLSRAKTMRESRVSFWRNTSLGLAGTFVLITLVAFIPSSGQRPRPVHAPDSNLR